MKRIQNLLKRHRLMTNTLALLLLVGVLAITPASGDDNGVVPEGGGNCENGCINWNAQNGCVECQRCCVYSNGGWACWMVQPGACS